MRESETLCSSHQSPTLPAVSTETQHNWYLSLGNIAQYFLDTELLVGNRYTHAHTRIHTRTHACRYQPSQRWFVSHFFAQPFQLQSPSVLLKNKHTHQVWLCVATDGFLICGIELVLYILVYILRCEITASLVIRWNIWHHRNVTVVFVEPENDLKSN